MADSTSARFAAPLYSPDGSDVVNFADQVNAIVEAFDAQAALISQAFSPGGIMLSAAQTPPAGWLRCDGSAVSRTTYSALFSAISTAFGAGDGSTTFNLPDYRGRVPIGSGAGAGLTTRVVGAKGGEETHALFGSEGTLLPQSILTDHIESTAADTGFTAVPAWVAGTGADLVVGDGNSCIGVGHNNVQPFVACSVFIRT